jgi:hypothetical protein
MVPENGDVQDVTKKLQDEQGNVLVAPRDFKVQIQSDVPEPSTFVMAATMAGLGLSISARRRRRPAICPRA